jgi:hypothetical protein
MSRRPKIDDTDRKTGNLKYASYEEYEAALDKWGESSTKESAGWTGIGFGSAMAMVLSFELNRSIWWIIVHGICSWGYVIYRAWEGNY